jgi:hypothetical protein
VGSSRGTCESGRALVSVPETVPFFSYSFNPNPARYPRAIHSTGSISSRRHRTARPAHCSGTSAGRGVLSRRRRWFPVRRRPEAAALHDATAATRASVRAELEAVRARRAERAVARSRNLRGSWPAVAPVDPARVAEPPVDPAAVLDPADLALLRQATANARAAYGKRQPPPVAQVLHLRREL